MIVVAEAREMEDLLDEVVESNNVVVIAFVLFLIVVVDV